MKICSSCKTEKEETEFYKVHVREDKPMARCKICLKEVSAKRYLSKKKVCGIYKITSPTGRVYIGQSCDILTTWGIRYKKDNPHCKQQPKLYNSILKYGWQTHVFEIVELCDINLLNHREIYYIGIYNSQNAKTGMNCTVGGEGTRGHKWSDESKKRASDSKKNLYKGGYKNPLLGRKLSPERVKKMSEASKGKLKGEKNPFYGKRHSEEMKKLIGSKGIGRKFSKEVLKRASERMSGSNNHMYGIKLSGSKNGMYGKKHKKESFMNIVRIILNVETGIFYYGLREAADSINSTPNALAQKFKRGSKTKFIYA